MKAAALLSVLFAVGTAGVARAGTWTDLWSTREQQAQKLLDSKHPDQAAPLFGDARRRGYAQMEAGQFDKAAKSLAPFKDADSQYNRGNALAHTGQLRDALSAYDAALAASPGNKDVIRNRDLVARALKQQQQAQSGQQGRSKGQPGSQGSQGGQSQGGNHSPGGNQPQPGDQSQAGNRQNGSQGSPSQANNQGQHGSQQQGNQGSQSQQANPSQGSNQSQANNQAQRGGQGNQGSQSQQANQAQGGNPSKGSASQANNQGPHNGQSPQGQAQGSQAQAAGQSQGGQQGGGASPGGSQSPPGNQAGGQAPGQQSQANTAHPGDNASGEGALSPNGQQTNGQTGAAGLNAENAQQDANAALRYRQSQQARSAPDTNPPGPNSQASVLGGDGKAVRPSPSDVPPPKPPSEQAMALDQWLRGIPDDSAELLRRKFLIEHMLKQQQRDQL